MSKRGTGVVFCFLAAFLLSVQYLSAAIFGSNVSSWNPELFQHLLYSVGDYPLTLSKFSLFVGIGYIIWAEVDEYRRNHKPQNNK
ncbi:hypothetical protein GC102_31380 [Paenibacillus sp. LMG 31460]|uniref:DUF4306 domain-containing protein n=1 Tax=Paenibacillus germinis TaxID=2654979 RepID=A0ABX1ZD97_9BACL|nr:hypothetical protein [Paenibacillus germinis]NOU90214.1 hypothetical protein [Paenibacillus germinis]